MMKNDAPNDLQEARLREKERLEEVMAGESSTQHRQCGSRAARYVGRLLTETSV